VVDEDDLGGAEQPLADRQTAQLVRGDDAAGVADDVRVALGQAEQAVGVEAVRPSRRSIVDQISRNIPAPGYGHQSPLAGDDTGSAYGPHRTITESAQLLDTVR
jgi:hypothetical protein